MSNKIVGSLASKVIGLCLLCFLGANIMYNIFGISYLMSSSYPDGLNDYTESVQCETMVEDKALNIFWVFKEYGKDTARNVNDYGDYSNLCFTIDKYDEETESYIDVCDNDLVALPISSVDYTYFIALDNNNDFTFFDNSSEAFNSDLNNIKDIYKMNVYLETPLLKHDVFYNANSWFKAFYFQGESNLYFWIIIEAVAFILTLIFEFASAGHKNGYEGIHTIWIDKIPYEFMMLYFFGILVVAANGCGSLISFDWTKDSYSLYSLHAIIAAAMFISLNIYLILMTTARRIKAGLFIKSFVTYRIIRFAIMLFKAIPVVLKISIPALIYLFIEFIVSNHYMYGRYYLIHMLMALGITVLLIYFAYQFSFIYKAGKEIANGNTNYKIDDKYLKIMTGEIKEHAHDLNELSDGINLAVQKEMKSERLKTELITNVSHDIKTPLTSIINYTDLLSKEHTAEEEKQYIDVLSRQSNKLKKLIEDLVEASKASSGNISANIVPLNVRELIEQSIAEYDEKLSKANLEIVLNIKDEPICLLADGRLLWRVLSNLLSNVSKYALVGTRVYIDVERTNHSEVSISIKNISKDQLNIDPEELTERFVRGDASRHTEGSGLGLNIVKSLVEVQKGRFEVNIDGDLFKAIVYLPESKN